MSTHDFLSGGGEMGALMRAHDWSRSSLGPPAGWPQSLRTVVRLMLNTGHPMYVWWGADGACLYNDAYRESIGPERHPGSLGRPAREVWDEIWDIIGPQIDQVMTGGGATWHVNHLVPITRHGKRDDVYWTYSYSPIDDEASPRGIGGVLVLCTETTQQVLAERRITSERDRLAHLFAQAPSFMALLRGPEHRFEIANPAFLAIAGGRPVIGRTVAEAVPEAVAQGYLDLLDRVFTSGEAYRAHSAPFTLQATPDGLPRARVLDFVFQPIKDVDGRVTGIFIEGAEVTERARADEALRESEARYRVLAEQLSDTSRLKDEFLATLAHELRNPLAPIRNALESMRLAPADRRVADTGRELMERQLSQMVRLIDDLMDLSRVSRGIVELRRSPLSLAAALRDAVETSQPMIERAGNELAVSLPEEDFVIHGDPTRIVQVFANLLNNAAKFTPRGGHIALTLARADAATAVVSVRDDGVGISTVLLDRVFDMFAQVDRSHTHVGGGLGIGLTLVRRLVEMHGGTVEARSEGAGTGSEFVVRLPLATSTAPVASTSVPADPPLRPAARGRRIVVADDNVDAVESLGMMLELLGHETRIAHDGAQALAVAHDFRPDAMILDIAMPGLDGHDLARRIRAQPWGQRVLLIAASGWGQVGDKEESRAAGFDHHLVKPLQPEILDALLQSSE